jgi:hypothetical protein
MNWKERLGKSMRKESERLKKRGNREMLNLTNSKRNLKSKREYRMREITKICLNFRARLRKMPL